MYAKMRNCPHQAGSCCRCRHPIQYHSHIWERSFSNKSRSGEMCTHGSGALISPQLYRRSNLVLWDRAIHVVNGTAVIWRCKNAMTLTCYQGMTSRLRVISLVKSMNTIKPLEEFVTTVKEQGRHLVETVE
jgi:hypothetical protein